MQTEARQLVLFSTSECHLCDMAKQMLDELGLEYQVTDIAFDDKLFALYGERIPVLLDADNQRELGWPFEPEQIIEFLS